MSPTTSDWDSYFYPGTEVLRNLEDFRDQQDLQEFEEDSARIHAADLIANPVEGRFDRAHMQEIHRRLFEDVYDWAGKLRTAPQNPKKMQKNGPSPEQIRQGRYDAPAEHPYDYFPAGDEMVRHFDQAAELLTSRLNEYPAMTGVEFAAALAEPWGEMNVAHLFREGNTRAQVLFFTSFAETAGHTLNHLRFTEQPAFRLQFNAARFLVQSSVDYSLLAETLASVIDQNPADRPTAPTAHTNDGLRDEYRPHYTSDPATDA